MPHTVATLETTPGRSGQKAGKNLSPTGLPVWPSIYYRNPRLEHFRRRAESRSRKQAQSRAGQARVSFAVIERSGSAGIGRAGTKYNTSGASHVSCSRAGNAPWRNHDVGETEGNRWGAGPDRRPGRALRPGEMTEYAHALGKSFGRATPFGLRRSGTLGRATPFGPAQRGEARPRRGIRSRPNRDRESPRPNHRDPSWNRSDPRGIAQPVDLGVRDDGGVNARRNPGRRARSRLRRGRFAGRPCSDRLCRRRSVGSRKTTPGLSPCRKASPESKPSSSARRPASLEKERRQFAMRRPWSETTPASPESERPPFSPTLTFVRIATHGMRPTARVIVISRRRPLYIYMDWDHGGSRMPHTVDRARMTVSLLAAKAPAMRATRADPLDLIRST